MKKYLIKNIFYITIPLVLSYITSFLVNIDLPILIIIFYGILLFFLITKSTRNPSSTQIDLRPYLFSDKN